MPPHCVEGSDGSLFIGAVHDALVRAHEVGVNQKSGSRVRIAFKGFHPDVDSYGAFGSSFVTSQFLCHQRNVRPSLAGVPVRRKGPNAAANSYDILPLVGSADFPWTGSVVVENSGAMDGEVDSGPDMLALVGETLSLEKLLAKEKVKRVILAGFALDFEVQFLTKN